jgi:hypothetical protein
LAVIGTLTADFRCRSEARVGGDTSHLSGCEVDVDGSQSHIPTEYEATVAGVDPPIN